VAASVLRVEDRGGGNPFILDHAAARCSWVVSAPGSFSCVVSDRDARRWGAAGASWLGSKWVRLETADLPAWGGVVTTMRWAPGTLELGAESFHALLRRRRVPRTYGQQRATAGALAQRAYRDVQADDYTFIRTFEADETGDPIDFEWHGGDLADDVFRELATASGQEWTVDADRAAEWRVRLGADKSGTVHLAYPHEIVSYSLTGDLWTVENDIEGEAADTAFAAPVYDQAEDNASVKTRGRYQTTRTYPNVVSKGTVRPKVKRDLERLANPTQVVTMTVANVAHCWGKFQLGDTILATLPGADSRLRVRLGAIAVDVDGGTMELAGGVE
jgi:hypothetical protein